MQSREATRDSQCEQAKHTHCPEQHSEKNDTRDETRTRIALSCWRILSPLCLPIPPPGQCTTTATPRHSAVVADGATPFGGETVEPNVVADVLLHGAMRSAVTFVGP